MSDELKPPPCPLCQSDNLQFRKPSDAHGDVGHVKCCDCLAYASFKAWNTRHTPEAFKGVVEALEGWVDNHRYLDDAQVRELYESYENNPLYSKIIKARAALKAYKIHIGE